MNSLDEKAFDRIDRKFVYWKFLKVDKDIRSRYSDKGDRRVRSSSSFVYLFQNFFYITYNFYNARAEGGSGGGRDEIRGEKFLFTQTKETWS